MSLAFQSYLTSGVCLVGASLAAVAPVTPSAPDIPMPEVRLTAGDMGNVVDATNHLVGLIVGGTGTPIPQDSAKFPDYVQQANALFIQRILPGADSQGVFTPEGGSPIYTGVKSLPFDTSFAQGATMLKTYIEDNVATGNTVAVYGESQSSTISGMVMPELEKDGVAADAVKFVLVGNPSNPDGGLLERFNPLSFPALGVTFNGATPADSIYDTSIYTQEYDGFADFPKYTLNFLSDLNAFLGIEYVHPTYRDLSETRLDDAIKLPTSDGYGGSTDYYMIPMAQDEVVPLLRPLELIPGIGKPLADLLNPDLEQLINLGYDNPANDGWDVGQANVPTTFGLFPSLTQVMTAVGNMGPATEQGVRAFINDLQHPASTAVDAVAAGGPSGMPSLTDVVNALTSAFSSSYATLLPTADIVTSLGVNMPAYDASLFAQNLFTNPIDAIGLPIAADTGLVTLAIGIEFMTIEQAVQSVAGDLAGIF